jgi:nucleoside-diphosphate-sugar epimerase
MALYYQQLPRKSACWDLNMNSLFHVLNLAKAGKIKKYFGHRVLPFWTYNPKENTPQYTIMEPSTVYGISKQAGERW